MRSLVSIDPGVHISGVAHFYDNVLKHCCLNTPYMLYEDLVVIEKPQVYPQSKQKGDPNDLINLAIEVGVWKTQATRAQEIRLVHPREWKGQVPKEIHNDRVKKRLSQEELRILQSCGVSRGLLHNVIDAVGLGLWALGR